MVVVSYTINEDNRKISIPINELQSPQLNRMGGTLGPVMRGY